MLGWLNFRDMNYSIVILVEINGIYSKIALRETNQI